jgi:hypothetical protein
MTQVPTGCEYAHGAFYGVTATVREGLGIMVLSGKLGS